MITLKGENVCLRAIEPDDAEFILAVENDETFWEISNTQIPFSKHIINQYVLNTYKDIYEIKQLRLIIETNKGVPLGMIDLFDFDFKNKRAGVGVLIRNTEDRHKGYGKEALLLLIKYSFNRLDLHQLYCNISEDNIPSIKLFEKTGFKKVGLKKDWNYIDGKFKNEFLLQLIKTDVH